MARRGGRRRGRRTGSQRRASQKAKRASRSPSKSSPSSKSKSTKKKNRKPMGRSRHTPGGQHAANKNQNKKARRTVKSVKKAVSKVAKNVGKKVRNVTRGLAAKAGTHVANSQYGKKLKKVNWTKRDMSKLTPQQQRKYQRLSEKTGRDYSMRRPTFRLNLNADTLARFGGFADKGWYKGLTNRFPGIKTLKINKQFYGNPMKKGWHSSQRTGRGQGVQRQYDFDRQAYDTRSAMRKPRGVPNTNVLPGPQRSASDVRNRGLPNISVDEWRSMGPKGPQQDWLGDLYRTHNINQGNLDQGARDYWSNEAKTKGRDAVMQSIIGTSKSQGTYGGRKKPRRITTGSRRRRGGGIIGAGISLLGHNLNANRAKLKHDRQSRGVERRHAKSLAAYTAAKRGIL